MTSLGELRSRVRTLLGGIGKEIGLEETLKGVVEAISEASGCDSVGIRWLAGEDYPYCVTRGFGRNFVVREGPLCHRDAAGTVLRHPDGTPQLACMCGAVVSGRTDPRFPFFTKGGSFFTNSAQKLAPRLDRQQLGIHVRAYCMEVGYEVVALVPLRANGKTFGLIQMNCREVGDFTQETIREYEEMAGEIGEAVWAVMEAQPA